MNFTEEYQTSCAACGIEFCITRVMENARRTDGKTFYCPNGHPLVFDGLIQKLEKRISELERTLASQTEWRKDVQKERDKWMRRYYALKGVVTKQRNKLRVVK